MRKYFVMRLSFPDRAVIPKKGAQKGRFPLWDHGLALLIYIQLLGALFGLGKNSPGVIVEQSHWGHFSLLVRFLRTAPFT